MMTRNEGQQINLTCETSNCNPRATINWYKSSEDITNQTTFLTRSVEGLQRTISILLSTAVKDDNGKHVFCIASNSPTLNFTSNAVTLNVLYKPNVRSTPSNPYRVREYETATLICKVIDSNPNTSIAWKWIKTVSPTLVLHNGPTFTIPIIQRGRSGAYNCTASNAVGTSEAATITVDVQYKPEIRTTPSPYRVKVGEIATLVCTITVANPSRGIMWKWIKTGSANTVLHNESTFTMTNIQRGRSGTYNCTASNTVGTSEAATIDVDVLYKPEVRSNTSSPYRVRERETVTLMCTVSDANPNTGITWKWIKINSVDTVLHNNSYYTIYNIDRQRSGSYSCTASNAVGTSNPATITIDVQYEPLIEDEAVKIVNENERVVLTRRISSNPLSNAFWYDGTHLLKSETSVKTTNFTIEKAKCTDTNNFTLIASNALQRNVTSLVELIVNCRPISDMRNITLWVSDGVSLAFSTKIIAFPKPRYTLMFGNGMQLNGIGDSMAVNSVNNFTLYFYKTTVSQIKYGTYYLHINNSFGETTVNVNVQPQREPSIPLISEASCNVRSAQIQWRSSFNGGNI
ncbi:kin of IRRE-like protein 3 isoform X1 [Crassostrea virginica]